MNCPYCKRRIEDRSILLTSREMEVAKAATASSARLPEISKEIGMHLQTLRQYLRRIYRKLGVTGRLQLCEYWNCELFQIGLLQPGINSK